MASFLSYLIIGFAVASFLLGISYFRKNPGDKKNQKFFIVCLSSSLWSLGFGMLVSQTNSFSAWFCRCIGMVGVFPYLIFGSFLIMDLAKTKGLLKYITTSFVLLGIIIYPFVVQPHRQVFELTSRGMSYHFVSDFWTIFYNVYVIIVAFLIFLVLMNMLKSSRLRRDKILTKKLMLFLFIFVLGSVMDTLFPLLGFPAFPGSTISQFIGVAIVYNSLNYEVKNSASFENMANYIYHFVDFPLLVFNSKQTLSFMSDSAYTFFGYETLPKDLKMTDLFWTEDPIFDQPKQSWKEEFYCKRNGAYCQVSISKAKDRFKDIIGYIVVVYDLSDKNTIISELEIARIEAENANKAKDNFLANMSHEIRTPLNVVLGMNEMILKENDIHAVKQYAENIEEAGESLLETINDILDFSKIQSGQLSIVNSEYSLMEMLKSTIDLLKMQAKEKNLEMQIKVDPNLPSVLLGDQIRIKQILINIINNAIKYTEKGYIIVKVWKEQNEAEKTMDLTISVEDTGIGIKEEDLKNLFISFKRLEEKRNRMIEGTGLGLSIVKKLIGLMHGQIFVESKVGVGSKFTVRLPQKVVKEEPIGMAIKKPEIPKATEDKPFIAPQAKILVVDDNRLNLTVVKGLLKRTKAQIDFANSGFECLEKIKNEDYQIIFLDHMMPKLDGIETLHKMQKQEENKSKNAVVIALTANAVEGAREEYLQNGFQDYLSKPVSGKELEKKLREYLPKNLIESA